MKPFAADFRQVKAALHEASKCRVCGRPRLVLKADGYRRRYRPETVSIETHCACRTGPANPDRQATTPHDSEGESA